MTKDADAFCKASLTQRAALASELAYATATRNPTAEVLAVLIAAITLEADLEKPPHAFGFEIGTPNPDPTEEYE